MTGIDIDHQLLPDILTLPLMWLGLLAAVVIGPTQGLALPVSPRDAILGAIAGYLSLWSVFHLFRLITGKEGMGYGDFKLFAALGAWMGWQSLLLIILLSAATGAFLGILMILLRGRDRAAPMPFGPYLAAAGWIAMLYGGQLVSGYLRVSGLKY
jgi:leader peptidase (prepilin peptidase) / N-methyltransferase